MGWKFWERPKSEAELSLEQLQAGGGAPAAPPAAVPSAADGAPADPSFRMTVQDVFTITGRGTVVTGQVESGTVTVGEQVNLNRADGSTRRVSVTGVESFRQLLESAGPGQNVGLLLKDVSRDDVDRGDVLTG